MFKEYIKDIELIYKEIDSKLTEYYNKPYNYSKIVALMGKDFGKLLDIQLIELIFKAKRTIHNIEKQFTKHSISIEFYLSKMNIYEFRERKKYRLEAIQAGMTTETAIESHIDFKLTEYYCQYNEFNSYKIAIKHLEDFFLRENRNLEQLLSQGKSLAYNGLRYNDSTAIFTDGTDEQ